MDSLSRLLKIRGGERVAVIGAGGKHTFMCRLSQELAAASRPVVLTSTTNLHRSGDYAALPSLLADEDKNWPSRLHSLLKHEHRVVVAGSQLAAKMWRGLEPRQIDDIRSAAPEATVLVKCDGARKRMLKAPSKHEPVFPQKVDLCVLILSLEAIGKPIDQQHVHRLERVLALTSGSAITARTFIDLIIRPGGYADRLPPEAVRVLYLSHDRPGQQEAKEAIFAATADLFGLQLAADTIAGRFVKSGLE